MKVTYRIPTEMYAFAEVSLEVPDAVTPAELRGQYDKLANAFKPQPINTLPDKEYNTFIDNMLLGTPNHLETYNAMSPQQKDAVQVLKRAIKRLKSKESLPVIND